MKSIVIFGGAGFIGRHLIRSLAKKGHKIIVPYQRSVQEAKLRLLGVTGQIIPFRFSNLDDKRLNSLLIKTDICINLKTTYDQKKGSFDDTIFKFNKKLIKILKTNFELRNYIYFSGLGADIDKNSRRSIAIHKTEKEAFKHLKNVNIIRPGVIIGGGDVFLKRLLPIFKSSFFVPLFGDGSVKFQPVFIDDISLAVEKIINDEIKNQNIYELAGPEILTYRNFYNHISKCLNKTRVLVPVSLKVMKPLISIAEKTPISPLTSEQLLLFEKDNVLQKVDKTFEDLSINPQDVLQIIKNIVEN
ncbi:MAG: NAD-dependent epimerase/dehydratase family protein [Alphaproteobacteria bacterium]